MAQRKLTSFFHPTTTSKKRRRDEEVPATMSQSVTTCSISDPSSVPVGPTISVSSPSMESGQFSLPACPLNTQDSMSVSCSPVPDSLLRPTFLPSPTEMSDSELGSYSPTAESHYDDPNSPTNSNESCSATCSAISTAADHVEVLGREAGTGALADNSELGDDIGLLLKSVPQSDVQCFSSAQKFFILSNHFRPNRNFRFPSKWMDGCRRSCQYSYLEKNPWFVYSKEEDGLFCLPCVLFANKPNLGQLVTHKFNHWTKKTSKFSSHNSKQYHQLAMTQVDALKSSHSRPEVAIDNQLRGIRAQEIAINRAIIRHIADAVYLCGSQNIALRGHRDDYTAESGNKGTFLAILNYSVRSGNEILRNHFEECPRNAVYTSKTIQNQMIEVIEEYIRDQLLKEIKQATYYSVLCDEVTDVSNQEQISIVLRFVDSSNLIREEFVDFVGTDRITGEVLASKIKATLTKYGLDFQNCRGQGYDGASNMSARHGVQGILAEENEKAIYVHCNSHVLNLCIVQVCSLQSIRNMNSTVTESAFF